MQDKTQKILTWSLLAALILWGGYSLLMYLGVPVHRSSLMSDADSTMVANACTSTLCQGAASVLPFLSQLAHRMSPVLWYGVISAVLFLGFAIFMFIRQGSLTVRLKLRPWHFGALFVGAVWLMFTVFSAGTMDGMPTKRTVEPSAQVYQGASPATLEALNDHFVQLRDDGCLTQVGEAAAGVGIYDIRGLCTQGSFMTRVLSQIFVIAGFLFLLLIAGHTLLMMFRVRLPSILAEGVVSLGLGAGAWIAALWLMALLGAYTANVGWCMIIAGVVLCFRSAWWWIRAFLFHEWEVELRLYDAVFLLGFLLMSYLALNFLVVVRPFPIGWDDLGSYINRPRLLVSYGHAISTMGTFQWEYLTSLGFLLFGYHSYFAATASMIINWSEGLMAVLLMWLFGRTYFGARRGVLTALLLYSLPLIGHFSFADMKIDNAVFFTGGLALYLVFLALFPLSTSTEQQASEIADTSWRRFLRREPVRLCIIGGLIAGLAFGMKITAAMVITAACAVIIGASLSWHAAAGAALLSLSVFANRGFFRIDQILGRMFGFEAVIPLWVTSTFLLVIAVIIIGYAAMRATVEQRKNVAVLLVSFIVAAGLACAPWLLYNNAMRGRLLSPELALSPPDTISPNFFLRPEDFTETPSPRMKVLPAELALDPNNAACRSTATAEELDRYWGTGYGWKHYVTLPWRTVMNTDIGGYYVTTIPALLLFPLLLLVPFFWDRRAKWLRYLWFATALLVFEWMFLANGVPWYGVGMFFGLTLCLEALSVYSPNKFTKIVTSILLAFSLLIAFGMRFWQFEMQYNLLEYPLGKISAEALEQRTIPYYSDIEQVATYRHNTLPNQPYVYRVGTFIPYFVPKNTEVLGLADHQLSFFNCLNQERDPQKTLARLIALGFNSVIFDTNTATIERDPNGTLHQKVNGFVDFLNTPGLGVKIVVNDVDAGIAYILLPPVQ